MHSVALEPLSHPHPHLTLLGHLRAPAELLVLHSNFPLVLYSTAAMDIFQCSAHRRYLLGLYYMPGPELSHNVTIHTTIF